MDFVSDQWHNNDVITVTSSADQWNASVVSSASFPTIFQPTDYYYDISHFHHEILATFNKELLTFKKPFTIVLIALYSVAFIIGFIGNMMVIVVVIKLSYMRTVTNTFLVNLAVGDLFVVIVCLPFSLAPYVYRQWIYGTPLCKLSPFIQGTSVGVSVLTLLAISLDRFYAIYKPLRARLIFSEKRVKCILLSIWVVSMALSSPVLFVNQVKIKGVTGIAEIKVCEEHWKTLRAKQLYNIFMFILLYSLPVASMSVAYIRIARTLWSGDEEVYKGVANGNADQANKIIQGRRKIVRMLIFVVGMFAVSWMPYHAINIYMDFNRDTRATRGILAMYGYPLVQWLSLSNSAFNPMCYCFFSRRFRKAFKVSCMFWPCCDLSGVDNHSIISNLEQSIRRSRSRTKETLRSSILSSLRGKGQQKNSNLRQPSPLLDKKSENSFQNTEIECCLSPVASPSPISPWVFPEGCANDDVREAKENFIFLETVV